ncbi:Importin subunit alpha [Hondaea fermentalgiana]|uniref:Importin subunit alpha n=1 Tax=Hondaea fermentalgiana TaxID=2315210 RepID=A0A2R5GTS1_9STRA|nr:Importin subunit alpha [Hondaea fermentalgiana]|eukprot:GBG34266.1 Importin subunit alpha [Hondaea fermentalgiana]
MSAAGDEEEENIALRLLRRCTARREEDAEDDAAADEETPTMRRARDAQRRSGAHVRTQRLEEDGDEEDEEEEEDSFQEDGAENDAEDDGAPRRAARGSGVKRPSQAGSYFAATLSSLFGPWIPGGEEQRESGEGNDAEDDAANLASEADEDDEEHDSGDSDRSFYTRDGSTRGTIVAQAPMKRRQSKLTTSVWPKTAETKRDRDRIEKYCEDLKAFADDVKEHQFTKQADLATWMLGIVAVSDEALDSRLEGKQALTAVLREAMNNARPSNDEHLRFIVAASMLVVRLDAGSEGSIMMDQVREILSKLVLTFQATIKATQDGKRSPFRPAASGVVASALAYILSRASDARSMRDEIILPSGFVSDLIGFIESLDVTDDETRGTLFSPCVHVADFICCVRPFLDFDVSKGFVQPLASKLKALHELEDRRTPELDEEDIAFCNDFHQRALGMASPVAEASPSSTRALGHAMAILANLCDGLDHQIAFVVKNSQILSEASALLKHPNLRIYMSSLRLLGNVVTGSDDLTQTVIDVGAVPSILEFVTKAPSAVHGDEGIPLYKESLWLLSNILAGNEEQINYILDLDAMKHIIEVLRSDQVFAPLKSEALWCVRNALAGGTPEHVQKCIDADCIEAFVPVIAARGNVAQDSILCVEGLAEIFRTLREHARDSEDEAAQSAYEDAKTRLRESHGVEVLDQSACGSEVSASVTQLAQEILRQHFEMSNDNWVNLEQRSQMFNFGGYSLSDSFQSLGEAVTFWRDKANEGVDEESEEYFDELLVDPYVSADNVRGVLVFLSKLRISQEFQNTSMQTGLARRVMDGLETLCSDEFAREEIIARMVDSVDTCGDKPIWALNQISLVSRVAHARGNKEELRKVGRGVMNLDIVHEHVRRVIDKFVKRNGGVDDVCVYLRFEIELREDLDLPVSAQDMIYSTYVQIDKADLEAARTACKEVDDEAFEVWLSAWPEWIREERREFADETDWAELDQEELSRNSLRDSLTNLFGDPVEDPIRLLDPDHPGKRPVWSLKDLLRHWVATGMDLHGVHRSTDDLRSNLRRCTRRKSIRSMLSFKSAKSVSPFKRHSSRSNIFVEEEGEDQGALGLGELDENDERDQVVSGNGNEDDDAARRADAVES